MLLLQHYNAYEDQVHRGKGRILLKKPNQALAKYLPARELCFVYLGNEEH